MRRIAEDASEVAPAPAAVQATPTAAPTSSPAASTKADVDHSDDAERRAAAILAAFDRDSAAAQRPRRRLPPPMSALRAGALTACAAGAAVVITAVALRGVADQRPIDAVVSGGVFTLLGVFLTVWATRRIRDDVTRTPTTWMATTAVRLLSAVLIPTVLIFAVGAAPVSAVLGAFAAAVACLVFDAWLLYRQVMGRPAPVRGAEGAAGESATIHRRGASAAPIEPAAGRENLGDRTDHSG